MTGSQLTDEQPKLIVSFLPIGEYGRYLERLLLPDRLRVLPGLEERRSLHCAAGEADRRSHPPGRHELSLASVGSTSLLTTTRRGDRR